MTCKANWFLILRILLLLLLFNSFPVAAKEYPMLHYTVEDGLPSNTIYEIYQDPDGFIWIGTDKGIARYNGQQFEIFTTADGLADNECLGFTRDYEGRLWIRTFNGRLCYYKDGTFHTAKNASWLKSSHEESLIEQLILNKDSTLTVLFRYTPAFVEINKDQLTVFSAPFMHGKYAYNSLRYIMKISGNRYRLLYSYNEMLVDRNMNVINTFDYDKFCIWDVPKYSRLPYFITAKHEVLTGDYLPVHLKSLGLIRDNHIYKIAADDQYEVVSTSVGVFFNDLPAVLPDKHVQVTTKDKNGTYWMGTAKHGIYLLNEQFLQTYCWKNVYDNPVIFAQRDERYFFFGTQNRNVYRIKEDEAQSENIFEYRKHVSETGDFNNSIHSGQWIDNNNYNNFSEKNNFIICDIRNDAKPKVKKIIMPDLSGISGVFQTGQLVYLKSRSLFRIIKYTDLVSRTDSLGVFSTMYAEASGKMIFCAAQEKNRQLWFSTIRNLYKIKDTARFVQPQFGKVSFREFTFSGNYMVGVSHNNELLLTNNYEAPKVVFDTVRTNDCVWDKFYKLNDSNLLISTNNYYRILTLHQSKGKPVYSIRLLENLFIPYQPEFLYVDSSSCYFFKNGSISGFPISFILEKKGLPSLKFVSLTAAGNTVAIRDTMDLSYADSRSINILFGAISFNHKNLTYEYTINNRQDTDSWMVLKGEELNLIKPGFGNYRIKVRAKTMSGEYSPAASFLLSVGKPFWAAWWFLVTGLVLLILLIGYIARLGVRRSLRKKESEVRFLRSEYKALNALMNPHFIFNSLNSVQSLVNNNENIRASKYIRIFSDLIRQNMRNVSQELISLSKEMDLVKNYLKIEQLRFKDQLSYTITVDEDVEADLIMIPPLLIQPLVENAIKHGIWPKKTRDGFIAISIYEKGEELHIEIVDNGVGLHAGEKSDTLHESYAMSNIDKRIEQLSQIHRKKITVQITELKDEEGRIKGVRSLVTISLEEPV